MSRSKRNEIEKLRKAKLGAHRQPMRVREHASLWSCLFMNFKEE